LAKRKKQPSRADRWNDALGRARPALSDLKSALEDLEEVRQEYVDWRDNLPENLGQSPVGEKLNYVSDELDVENAVSELETIESLLDDAEGADLPLGFGRD
jgi:hypothetical protein